MTKRTPIYCLAFDLPNKTTDGNLTCVTYPCILTSIGGFQELYMRKGIVGEDQIKLKDRPREET